MLGQCWTAATPLNCTGTDSTATVVAPSSRFSPGYCPFRDTALGRACQKVPDRRQRRSSSLSFVDSRPSPYSFPFLSCHRRCQTASTAILSRPASATPFWPRPLSNHAHSTPSTATPFANSTGPVPALPLAAASPSDRLSAFLAWLQRQTRLQIPVIIYQRLDTLLFLSFLSELFLSRLLTHRPPRDTKTTTPTSSLPFFYILSLLSRVAAEALSAAALLHSLPRLLTRRTPILRKPFRRRRPPCSSSSSSSSSSGKRRRYRLCVPRRCRTTHPFRWTIHSRPFAKTAPQTHCNVRCVASRLPVSGTRPTPRHAASPPRRRCGSSSSSSSNSKTRARRSPNGCHQVLRLPSPPRPAGGRRLLRRRLLSLSCTRLFTARDLSPKTTPLVLVPPTTRSSHFPSNARSATPPRLVPASKLNAPAAKSA